MLRSEWSTYELEDIVWDEIGESDDNIVPCLGLEKEDACGVNAYDIKNPCIELASSTERSGDEVKIGHDAFDARNGTRVFSDTKREPLPATDDTRWPDTVLIDPNRSGSISKTEVSVYAGEETLDKDRALARALIPDFPNSDPILKSQIPMNYGDLCRFSLTDISTTETDLEFFASELEDEESTTFLGYGWPNIGNFEDIDKMFRNCDATYGQTQQTIDNVDLGWTSSSSLGISGTDAKSVLGYSDSLSQLNLPYEENLDDCSEKVKKSSQMRKNTQAGAQRTLKCQSRSVGKRKNIALGHNAAASIRENGLIVENQRPSPPLSKTNAFPSLLKAPEIQTSRSSSLTCTGAGETHMHLGYNYNHHHGVMRGFTCTKPDGGRHASVTGNFLIPNDELNHISIHSLVDAVPKTSGMTPEEKIEKLRRRQKMRAALSMMQQQQELHSQTTTATVDHSRVQRKQAQEVHNEGGDQTKVETRGIKNTVAEISSFGLQPSCMSSFVPVESSLEEACLHQLKDAITQLHDETKLCIRDSLYRLAKSAMERHNVGDSSSCSKTNEDQDDGLGMGGATTTEKVQFDRYDGLMNMETVTNPMDRAIAHLLFHKPNDVSRQTAAVALPLEAHIMGKIQHSWMLRAYGCCSGKNTPFEYGACEVLKNPFLTTSIQSLAAKEQDKSCCLM